VLDKVARRLGRVPVEREAVRHYSFRRKARCSREAPIGFEIPPDQKASQMRSTCERISPVSIGPLGYMKSNEPHIAGQRAFVQHRYY
jgi:hypothetical protein